ncbi:Panacea domain-containing protein [Mycobacteroides abscessus]|uniref:DUF4065 domain-containing protein n=1 Tax=Mycobacteroides abscessus TaxID=36809 RepID=A0ABD7HPX6_9MYCO|nr:Panacea domain-containing protein [Mycobacteroides abscessus]AWG62996.1 DUF4065 domain-containing protein [Mycobacteroides abscessus]PVA29595.1 DUF4065 domain-containing protein [Mycobacteroides abscessus]PVA43502.1 DUF4065 domain-containing protein [Mycobacteroides abscessus]PVB22088.1 DUF4065 domain-containing protein [Mycobacteroides abscessus]RIQ92367.1 DUF4065 domain-containing protein [Mycobacteroides abscessus]
MATANDVAAYILRQRKIVESVRLQKLLYYSQAWHLVAMDAPLFEDQIAAYELGPVVHSVWKKYEGQVTISHRNAVGDPDALTDSEREVVDAVIEAYRRILPFELSALTHIEAPWVDAWARRFDRGISHEAMRSYYASEVVKPKSLRTTPQVPHVPRARVTYIDANEFDEIEDALERPDEPSGLLAAVTRRRK